MEENPPGPGRSPPFRIDPSRTGLPPPSEWEVIAPMGRPWPFCPVSSEAELRRGWNRGHAEAVFHGSGSFPPVGPYASSLVSPRPHNHGLPCGRHGRSGPEPEGFISLEIDRQGFLRGEIAFFSCPDSKGDLEKEGSTFLQRSSSSLRKIRSVSLISSTSCRKAISLPGGTFSFHCSTSSMAMVSRRFRCFLQVWRLPLFFELCH